MRISVVNFKSQKDVIKNIALMKDYIEKAVDSGTDFVVFPELCITGYYYFLSDPKMINEELVAQAVSMCQKISCKQHIYICFGAPYYEADLIYNAAFITCPDNTVKIYKKIHICGYEHQIFSKGRKPLILNTEYGKIGFGICYDTIRYPELIRYYCYKGVNLYVNLSAVTEDAQCDACYLKRVIEYHVLSNGIYIASSNVCGIQNGDKFSGGSCVTGPVRKTEKPIHYYCNEELSQEPGIFTAEIKPEENLRMIFDGNRFSPIPDFDMNLYYSWYQER